MRFSFALVLCLVGLACGQRQISRPGSANSPPNRGATPDKAGISESRCSQSSDLQNVFMWPGGTCALNECSTTDGCPISKSNLLTTLPTLNKEFFVSVEFKATAWRSGWQNVIHFTEDGDCCKVGQRIPGLWVSNSGQLYPRFAVNGNGDFGILTTKKYPLNQWITVQFSQTLENGKYIYRVLIDGKSEIEEVNSQPKIFSNVKVYSSDSWNNALSGSIRNFIVNAHGSKKCAGWECVAPNNCMAALNHGAGCEVFCTSGPCKWMYILGYTGGWGGTGWKCVGKCFCPAAYD